MYMLMIHRAGTCLGNYYGGDDILSFTISSLCLFYIFEYRFRANKGHVLDSIDILVISCGVLFPKISLKKLCLDSDRFVAQYCQ